MEIEFTVAQRSILRDKLKNYFEEHFDQEIGELKTTLLLDFFNRGTGTGDL